MSAYWRGTSAFSARIGWFDIHSGVADVMMQELMLDKNTNYHASQ